MGTFTFPENLKWLMEAMASAASQTYTSVSSPIQYAGVTAFRGGIHIERTLWHYRRIYSKVGQECVSMLIEAGVRIHPPEGAFYLFPDFSPFSEQLEKKKGIKDSQTLCEKLLQEKHVAIIPGKPFERPEEELTARMSYVNFDGAKALAASETLPLHEELPNDFTQRWCAKTIEATKRIVDWLSELS